MNKRGGTDRLPLMAGEVAVAAFAAILIINAAVNWSSFDTPHKVFLVNDMGTIINILLASPGNMIVNYDEDASDYHLTFEKNKISISEGSSAEPIVKQIPSMGNIFYSNKEIANPNHLQFAKLGDNLTVEEKSAAEENGINNNLNLLSCNWIKINEEDKLSLTNGEMLIDPAYKIDEDKEPPRELCEIANNLILKLGINNIKSTRELDRSASKNMINCENNEYSLEDSSLQDYNLILSLRTADYKQNGYNNDKNTLKAYVVYGSKKMNESMFLSCLIVNKILTNPNLNNIKIDGVAVVPINPEFIPDYYPPILNNILEKEKQPLVILIEIGNSNSGDNLFEDNSIKALAESISLAMRESNLFNDID